MRSVRGMRIASIFAVGGLALTAAACGEAPKDDNNAGSGAKKFSACMVTDVGGIDDKSFNTSAWKGLQEAKAANDNIDIKFVASKAEADYEPNLTQFVNQKCNFILAVGGLMGNATEEDRGGEPEPAVRHRRLQPGLDNVYPMQFDTAQAAFQAGYLAAGEQERQGRHLRWSADPAGDHLHGRLRRRCGVLQQDQEQERPGARLGQGDPEGLLHQRLRQAGRGQEGLRRAGRPGRGHHHAGRRRLRPRHHRRGQGVGRQVLAIWVDVDGCESTPDCSAILTTVVKNIPDAVKEAVVKAAGGDKLPAKPGFVGTLANNGVSIAPYHDFDSKVPAELKAEIDKIKADIAAGTITVTSKAQPTK